MGQLYVVSDVLPRVFDADGQFVRDLGSVGAGPGEFRSISAATLVAPDTVVFFDVGLSRLTYYHANGRYLRSLTSGPGIAFSLDLLPRGELLAVGAMSGKAPLLEAHIIDRNGQVRASFAPGVSTQEQRKTATADSRGVYSSRAPYESWAQSATRAGHAVSVAAQPEYSAAAARFAR